ncbi:G4 quadruplex nucleic acid binding protein [Scheffersomyces amazonensis]|uniref:G4 quadruplex nucleic acid binding protein n=1 Tax=Scheffersomyces amazonensis TaxID=1078765 RepID=UPI00315DEE66
MADFLTTFEKLSLKDISAVDESKFGPLTDEQKALSSQFQTLSGRLNEVESLTALNDNLRSKTFIVGTIPSKADFVVFEKVFPLSFKWTSGDDLAKYRHIIRWVDLFQTKYVDVPEAEKLKIDYDTPLPREVKEKKKPAAAAAAAAAPADAKAAKAEKSASPAPTGERKELTEEEKKLKAEAAKAKKAAKAKAKADANAAKAPEAAPSPALIDFRVGFIQKAEKHPNADSLYVSTIDMGDEEGPRTVCSGLVNYFPLEAMQQRWVVVVANLKPVTMRGIKSSAMVFCASKDNKVEFINPPANSKPGEKIFFETYDGVPEKQLNPKKKVWETVQPGFSTNENFEVTYTSEGKAPVRLVNTRGELCKNTTIVGAEVK